MKNNERTLFIIDLDGTLWEGNVIEKTVYKMYDEGLFNDYLDIKKDELVNILLEIYFHRRKVISEEILGKDSFREVVYRTFSKYTDENAADYLANKYFDVFDEVRYEITLKDGSKEFLMSIKNYGKLILWTDGHYINTIELLKNNLGGLYGNLFEEEIYPEKLYTVGFSDPFKPNLKVVEMLIRKYKPKKTIVVGDHPYYDGIMSKYINGKSIILADDSETIIDLLNGRFSVSPIAQLHYDEIVELYMNGKIVLAKNFDDALKIISKLTSDDDAKEKVVYNR